MTGSIDDVVDATAEIRVGGKRLGSGVMVDDDLVLTAQHVVAASGAIEVVFPGQTEPLRAHPIALEPQQGLDVAVLRLTGRPPTVRALPVMPGRLLPAAVKVFGFPKGERSTSGVWRDSKVSGKTTSSTVQLDWIGSGTLPGHSGGPVVTDLGELAGILLQGSKEGRFDRFLPMYEIERAWPQMPRTWLFAGTEARAHAQQRALGRRGGVIGTDQFQGREHSLATIGQWLAAVEPPGSVLVLTGQPGAGKSAVVCRAALDREASTMGGSGETGVFLHAKDATWDDLVTAVGRMIGRGTISGNDELLMLLDAAAGRPRKLAVVIDALDEASTLVDGQRMAETLSLLARLPWVRVVVATRPLAGQFRYEDGSLLAKLGVTDGSAFNLADLDEEPYADPGAVLRYAEGLLEQRGVSYPGPTGAAWATYREAPEVRTRLATVVADRATGNFLVVAMASDQLSRAPKVLDPASPGFAADRIPSSVEEALDKYFREIPDDDRRARVRSLLTALAHAHGAGIDDDLWVRFARVWIDDAGHRDLDDLRASPGSDFVVTTSAHHGDGPVTRLFHQALTDQLLLPTTRAQSGAVYQAVLDEVASRGGWSAVPYAQRHASEHALLAERVVELIADNEYLTYAEPHRLAVNVRALARTATRSAVLRALELMGDGSTDDRSGYLALAGMIEDDAHLRQTDVSQAPWTAAWTFWSNRVGGDLVTTAPGSVVGLALRNVRGRPALIICTHDEVSAVDRDHGLLLWTARLPSAVQVARTTPDGSLVVAALESGKLHALDGDHGHEVWSVDHPVQPPYELAVDVHDGQFFMATGTYNEGLAELSAQGTYAIPSDKPPWGVVRVWTSPSTAEPVKQWTRGVFGAGVTSLRFLLGAGAGRLLVAGDPAREDPRSRISARVVDVTTGEDVSTLPAADHGIPVVACADGDDVFVLGSGHLVRWSWGSNSITTSPSPMAPAPRTFFEVAQHQGQRVLFLENNGEPVVMDAANLTRLGQPYAAREPLSALTVRGAPAPDEPAALATGDLEGDVRVWTVADLTAAGQRTLARIVAGCIDEGAAFVATVVDHPPPMLEVRDATTGDLICAEDLPPEVLHTVPGHPGEMMLGYRDGRVERRRLRDLGVIWSLRVHESGVNDITVWGDLVLSVGWDHCVRISALADGSVVRPPVHIGGWEDKGLPRVAVVTATDGSSPVVVAGPTYPGFAAWSLDDLLSDDEDSDDRSHWVRAPQYEYWVRTSVVGGHERLLVHADSRHELRLYRLAPNASPVSSRIWRPHDHTVTAVSQAADRIWTGDSWGNVRWWANPTEPDEEPQPLMEVRLRRRIVDLFPCGPDSVVVATESGLVRLDRHGT